MNCVLCFKRVTAFRYGVYDMREHANYVSDYLDGYSHSGCLCDACVKKLQLKVIDEI